MTGGRKVTSAGSSTGLCQLKTFCGTTGLFSSFGNKEHVFEPIHSANQVLKSKTMDSARIYKIFLYLSSPSLHLSPLVPSDSGI